MKMVSTIARSSSAAKNKPPKKKKFIDPTFPYKTGLKTTLPSFFTFLLSAQKSEQPPTFATSGAWGLGRVHHNSDLSLGKLNKHGGGATFSACSCFFPSCHQTPGSWVPPNKDHIIINIIRILMFCFWPDGNPGEDGSHHQHWRPLDNTWTRGRRKRQV